MGRGTDVPAAGLVVVANRLPMEWDGERWTSSPGGLVAALDPLLRRQSSAWVGWGGPRPTSDDAPAPDLGPCRLVEVALSSSEVEEYYNGFANGALWPLYHDAIRTPEYHRTQFDAYRTVNARFAAAAARAAAPGACVWVHDYQLQLVPAMLRASRRDVQIGFFLHIPFPPVELFMQLPWRREILLGLLGADVVGFQTEQGAANFAALATRFAGATASPAADGSWTIEVPEPGGLRLVSAQAFPIGIDAAWWDAEGRTAGAVERAEALRREFGSPEHLLLGVDRLDYTKGIDIRIRAVAELMTDGHLTPGRAVLVQVATPSREGVLGYDRIREDVEMLVGRTNGDLATLGEPAVHYLHQDFEQQDLVALMRAADVMLVTPLRDGMNLVSKEYVATRSDELGALVLSEFTGASHELDEAWLVNPYDIEGLKSAIMQALGAGDGERRRRMALMRQRVLTHDVHAWGESFLAALREHDDLAPDHRHPAP